MNEQEMKLLIQELRDTIDNQREEIKQLENIRKEAIKWVEHNQYYFPRPNDLLNILNKGSE